MNDQAKNAVKAAMNLYAETMGVTLEEVGRLFQKHESTRDAIYLLVAMQVKDLPYAAKA